jgi:ParB family chromosome partitioning protein
MTEWKKEVPNMLDLSKLEAVTQTSDGKPILFDISEIMEDPNQPRQEFDETSLGELADNIRARGIKSPISVKPKNEEGKYIINHGARRYRASILAGLEKIPGFIDGEHADYDQIAENIHRENLTPLEIASFIKKRLSAGDKRADIARGLNRDRAFITQHAALIEPPEFLLALYHSGKCGSAVHLYELRNLYNDHAEKVVAWCEGTEEITRKGIIALKDFLNGNHNQQQAQIQEAQETEKAGTHPSQKASQKEDAGKEIKKAGQGTKQAKETEDADRIRKPLLLVRHGKNTASIILDRKPTAAGLIFIRYDSGEIDVLEVPASSIKLDRLIDASEG